jgi:hypothetical protein
MRHRSIERREKTTAAERVARKAFRAEEPKKAMTDYAKAENAFYENRERLKAERLARESGPPVEPSKKVRSKKVRQVPPRAFLAGQTKSAIVREWDDWIRTQPLEGNATARDARKFFLELKAKRFPTLLDFRSGSADKWQVVHGWLIDERGVSD